MAKKAVKKYVYFFGGGKADGRGDMKDLLGGKGAGLAEMTNLKIPVPAGFSITTEGCNEYFKAGKKYPPGMWEQVIENLKKVEKVMGTKLGDSVNPLLVSVRSGSKFSMPGMMDTVLNLGLNDTTINALIKKTGNERFVYDAYRRLITMFGSIVMGIDRQRFEKTLEEMKEKKDVRLDTDLTAEDLRNLVEEFKIIDGIEEALYDFWRLGFLNVVVTNQPDVARGFIAEELLLRFHLLLKEKLPIDDIFACIHDDKDNCNCRKPKSGMLLDAALRWDIDLNKSIMVGDSWKDIAAGENVKSITILLGNLCNRDVECDFRVFSIQELINIVRSLNDI